MFTSLQEAHPELKSADDARLIELTLAGQHLAFTELTRRYQPRLYMSTLKLTRSPETAEDIVQDTLVKAYCKLETFRGEASIYSWLFRIAFNQFLARRRRLRRPTYYLDEIERIGCSEPIDPSRSAEELIQRSEDRRLVHDAMKELDPQSRRILEMREMQGLSYEEISRELDIKMGTVRSRIARARSKLSRLLKVRTSPMNSPTLADTNVAC